MNSPVSLIHNNFILHFIFTLILLLFCRPGLGQTKEYSETADRHPFLLVSESDFEDLQERASQSPWAEMKEEVIAFALNEENNYDNYLSREPLVRASVMSDIMSKTSLAYILDPENRPFYIKKIKENLNYWNDLHKDRDYYSNGWLYHVPSGDAIYNSILALDIIHDHLSEKEREGIHKKIDEAVEHLYSETSWGLNKTGARGLWALYQGEADHPAIQGYIQKLYQYFTTDGVFAPGPTYSHRVTGTRHRDAKTTFMDIIHRQKIHDVYGDKRLIKGYEWIYGYSYTPTGRYYTFGDANPKHFNASGIAGYRASKFSEKAGRLAAKVIPNSSPPARLLHYVLIPDEIPEPIKPNSEIFFDGGAWFMENDLNEMSLSGAMWNATILGDYHQHKEVNSINISAYGEDVIRNVGYNGWGNGALGFTWEYINETAISGNTVLINGEDHQSRTGGAISEGFTSNLFDYASGYSGEALPNGKHQRNFVFVHPQDEKPGYYVLFDEVQINGDQGNVNVALHPNSDDYSIISEDLEYQWKIGPNYSDNDVFVSIFLGTSPKKAEIKKSVLLGGHKTENGHIMGEFLYSTYEASGKKNIVTAIFPFDENHPKPGMKRISGESYSGAVVNYGDGTTDYLIESSGSEIQSIEKGNFQGLATTFRSKDDNTLFYFIRKGTRFTDGKTGFSSDKPVSIHMKGSHGSIISSGATVTFELSGKKQLLLDGKEVEAIKSDKDEALHYFIPKGSYQVELK